MRCYQELCSAKLLLVLQISHFSFCSAKHRLGLLYTRQGGFPLHPSKPCPTPLCLLNATQVTDRGSVKAKLLSQKLLDRPSLCLKCSSPFNLEICERIGSETECWSIWGTRINLKKVLDGPSTKLSKHQQWERGLEGGLNHCSSEDVCTAIKGDVIGSALLMITLMLKLMLTLRLTLMLTQDVNTGCKHSCESWSGWLWLTNGPFVGWKTSGGVGFLLMAH